MFGVKGGLLQGIAFPSPIRSSLLTIQSNITFLQFGVLQAKSDVSEHQDLVRYLKVALRLSYVAEVKYQSVAKLLAFL